MAFISTQKFLYYDTTKLITRNFCQAIDMLNKIMKATGIFLTLLIILGLTRIFLVNILTL